MRRESIGGLGILDVLAIVLIVLKLCGVINLSWLWVLAPIWIPLAILLIVFIIVVGREFLDKIFKD